MSTTAWTPDQPLVSIRDVHKSFGDLEVLKGVSLDVKQGEVICIIGPSGSGKSTLIRCVNALNTIDSGSIKVEGLEVNDPELNKLELRKAHFVGDEYAGHAVFRQVLDRQQHFVDRFRIERSGDLVEQHDIRVHRQ